MRVRLVTGSLLLGVVLVVASPVGADDRPSGDGGAYVDSNGDPTAEAHDPGRAPVSDGRGPVDPCSWHVVIEDDLDFAVYGESTRLHSRTGRWLERRCPGSGAVAVDGAYLVPEGGLVDPADLAEKALASVAIAEPTLRTSPSENGRLYVQLPTWLWINPGWWHPYEATARAGRVWSTVRATPVATSWKVGDGRTVFCSGPGTPWRPGMTEGASACTHTYHRSSASQPKGTFALRATVTLEVTWISNVTDGGTLPAISRTSTLEVDVGEIQAIGTGGGS